MSRETAISTSYNQNKIVFIVTAVIISIVLLAILLFLTDKIKQSENDMKRYTNVPVRITPQPTSNATPTPRGIEPTRTPTLTPEEREQLVEDLKKSNPDMPQELIDEILDQNNNATESSNE